MISLTKKKKIGDTMQNHGGYSYSIVNCKNGFKRFTLVFLIVCIGLAVYGGVSLISGYLVPIALTAILLSLFLGSFTALIIGVPITILFWYVKGYNFDLGIIFLINSIAVSILIPRLRNKKDIVLAGLGLGILNAAVTYLYNLLCIRIYSDIQIKSGFAFAGGVLSALLAILLLFVIEDVFGVITPISLFEMANPNHPLLKKMLFESPGTYYHSIHVGYLSEAAAGEINANSLLAKVGAFYHDIGKIKRPYFFKENQITNDNPHDKITPELSIAIITSHVKDGMQLAQKYKLPWDIRRIIAEHHGTTLIRYFFALASNELNEGLEESHFRYDGPKPSTKEAGIVMLADSVEASVRNLNNPSISEFEGIIDKVINEKVSDGQVAECSLTIEDLNKIKAAFVRVLSDLFNI